MCPLRELKSLSQCYDLATSLVWMSLMFDLATRSFSVLLARVSVKAVAAFILSTSTVAIAEIIELHDRPWQIVSYSGTGTTAEPHGPVFDIAFESNGDLWIARQDGLFFYDGYEWKRYGTEHGLPSNVCRAVKVPRAGVLWVGTDRGCGTFDGEAFETHGSKEGLAGPSIMRIHEDPDGTLWFCCDHWPLGAGSAGLTSFSDGQWRSYGLQDGLPSDQLNNYYRDSKGQQYAVTAKGIARRVGDRWVPLDISGFPVGGYPFDLFETPNGELLCSIRTAPGVMGVFMTA
jgi:ligand-binding sensor domain-containing protein